MNRFTKDMATIDDMLPLLMFDFVQVWASFDKLLLSKALNRRVVQHFTNTSILRSDFLKSSVSTDGFIPYQYYTE